MTKIRRALLVLAGILAIFSFGTPDDPGPYVPRGWTHGTDGFRRDFFPIAHAQIGPRLGGQFVGGTITTPILFAGGSVTAPSVALSTATNNGFYWTANPYLAIAYGNATKVLYNFGSNTINNSVNIARAWASGDAAGTAEVAAINLNSAQTPDTMLFSLSSTANSLIIAEHGDIGFDFAHAAQTNPTLFIHSANQSTTQWISARHDGSNGIIDTGGTTALHLYSRGTLSLQMESGITYVRNAELRIENQDLGYGLSPKSGVVAGNKALVAATATNIILVSLNAGEMAGGTITYTVYSNDAVPDYNARSGTIQYQVVNDGGTEVCTIALARDQETEDGSSLAGSSTLTYTWDTDTSPANGCYIRLNAASGLTETVLAITYQATFNGSALGVVAQQ